MDLKSELKEKTKLLLDLQKVEQHLLKLQEQLSMEREELRRLLEILNKESQDVEQLEKLNLQSLFYTVLGNKEKQLERERQEYLQAFLRYQEHLKSIELLEFEIDILEKKMTSESQLKLQIKDLISQRKQELLRENPTAGRQIAKIEEEIKNNVLMVEQIKETAEAGQAAIAILEKMIEQLRQAKNWGNWDLLDTKNFSSYMKHSSIDKARELSYEAKQALSRFKLELQDVYKYESIHFDFSLNFESFGKFTAVFFDNLISDWIIQQRISNAFNNVIAIRDKVLRLLQYLHTDLPKVESEIVRLEAFKEELIISS